MTLQFFDRVINWVHSQEGLVTQNGIQQLMERELYLQNLNEKLYGKYIRKKPMVNKPSLSSDRTINGVTFSFMEIIVRMVRNKNLFSPSSLLLDPDNPCCDPPQLLFVGEVNTGTWMKGAKFRECSLPNHIIVLLFFFIDGLTIYKYSKLILEAVLTCCFWFNRKA